MTTTQKSYARAGFSLMEIMIAVMILGLVAAMVGPKAMQYFENSKKRTAKATMRSFKDAIAMYQMNVGQVPQVLKDLIKRPRDERASKKWEGPYIDKEEMPEDSWGNSFVYKLTPGAKHPYELYSRGPNGAEASKEEWISVWDE